jgi:hypothetical protein
MTRLLTRSTLQRMRRIMRRRTPASPGASLRRRGIDFVPAPSGVAGRHESGIKRAFLGQIRAVCLPFGSVSIESNGCPQFAFNPPSQAQHLSPYSSLALPLKHQLPGGKNARKSRGLCTLWYTFRASIRDAKTKRGCGRRGGRGYYHAVVTKGIVGGTSAAKMGDAR